MAIPLSIEFLNMDASEFVEARVRERVRKLEKAHRRVLGCGVVIEAPHLHRNRGALYQVKITLHLSGGDIVVNRDPGRDATHRDVYVAVRDAFDAAQRRLAAFGDRRRGVTRRHIAADGMLAM